MVAPTTLFHFIVSPPLFASLSNFLLSYYIYFIFSSEILYFSLYSTSVPHIEDKMVCQTADLFAAIPVSESESRRRLGKIQIGNLA